MQPPAAATPQSLESRFTLERPVGRGAFGEVFRATDLMTGRTVAIKRLIEGAADPSAAPRFDLESRLLARVSHPNVVGYVAHGVDDGRMWLALEWLEGEDLAQRQRRGPMMSKPRSMRCAVPRRDSRRSTLRVSFIVT